MGKSFENCNTASRNAKLRDEICAPTRKILRDHGGDKIARNKSNTLILTASGLIKDIENKAKVCLCIFTVWRKKLGDPNEDRREKSIILFN